MELQNRKKDKVNKLSPVMDSEYSNPPLSNPIYHTHDGIDQPRIDPKFLLGFQIFNSPPTHSAEEGTIVFSKNGIIISEWVRINRAWNLVGLSPASISNTSSLNFGAILPNTSADLTMALIGANIGDPVILGVDNVVISTGVNCADISFFAWVSAQDVITIRCSNGSAVNTANPAQGDFTSKIMQF